MRDPALQCGACKGYHRCDLQRAQQLGRYHLLDRIAFGGMAEIYRAKTFDHDGHSHLVAVKRVLAHLAEDDDFIQMLVDEAKIASLIRHGNIAHVYEFARAHGEYFIAMEYIDGKDLRSILEKCRAHNAVVPSAHAAWIGSEIALALHAAHCVVDQQGRALRLVHRDVSPSNVLCAYAGEVKLCDFGIAKATLSRVHTRTGVIKGKVKYMSPEQAMGRKLDHRSDIFSMGSVLYEMLTKIPPFTAANEMELLIKVRDARYTPVHELEPEVPPVLEAIVDRALTRSRSARFQSAEEMAIELKAFLADFAPGYTRSHLGRYLRKMFEDEIESELRKLEDYVIGGEVDARDLGENLIADALGPDAPYSKFTPIATPEQLAEAGGAGTGSAVERETRPRRASTPRPPGPPEPALARAGTVPPRGQREQRDKQNLTNARTVPGAAPTEDDLPPGADLHSAETKILDKNKDAPVMPSTGAGASTRAANAKKKHAGSPGGRDPKDLDPAIHDSPTLILKRTK
jgi:eukaryotic-like serine/threonine-protein kinase